MEQLTIKIVRFENMAYINLVAVGFLVTAPPNRQVYREVCLAADTLEGLSDTEIASAAWSVLEHEVLGWLNSPVPDTSDVINTVFTPSLPNSIPPPTQAPIPPTTLEPIPEEPAQEEIL